jgi:signal transduction histidine kinase
MKTTLSILIATLLLVLLSGLSLLGMDPEAARYDRLLSELSGITVTESALRQDILNARAGLLRNYDALNRDTDTLYASLRRLRQEGADPTVLQPLEDMVARQDDLTDQFKTNNALLQNSLAYFGLLSGRFGVAAQDGPLASAMTALSTSVLHLVLDTSADSAADVADKLDRFAREVSPGDDAELVTGILAHGRVLYNVLPATDHILELLYDLPRVQRLDAVRENILAHQRASRSRARVYRGLLYATSMLLLALLVYSGSQLRRYVLALRRQAAFEHTIATISMGFVNARPDQIGHRIESALATLAALIGADRAYFVISTDPPQAYCWCRNGTAWTPGWPIPALALAVRMADRNGMVYFPYINDMPDGPDKDVLKGNGMTAWMCVSAYGHGACRGVLGFDAMHSRMTQPASDGALLRTAADTISNAIGQATLERDRARLEASLQQVRRMETIGAVASGVAHNFNNIIGVILGYTEMEELHAQPDGRLAYNLQGIRHAAERARDLIDQILTFGRRKEPSRKNVSLQLLVAETESLLSVSLPPRAHLVVGSIPDDAVVSGDPVQLQQMTINLCNNAVQATDGPCVISVDTDVVTLAEPRFVLQGSIPPGHYVRIAVRDAGRGIKAAELGRLFEPFFTTRQDGNGLGLATVREIVRSHGGAIDVRSRLGEGSVFEVWIPQLLGRYIDADGIKSMHGNGETVLVVDEDHAGLLRNEEIVAALGYEPVGFAAPDQVLRTLGTTQRRFDALLIGNLRPTARALAFATQLHDVAPEMPILLTASADDADAQALVSAGVSEVVGEPLLSAELAAALSRWLPH